MPTTVHWVASPTLTANVTSANSGSASVAPTATRPATVEPSAGLTIVTVGAVESAASAASARSTMADSGGTVIDN